SAAVSAAFAARPGGVEKVWVYLRDKGGAPVTRLAEAHVSARARARRALRGTVRGVTVEDVPVVAAYREAVAARVSRVRQEVRWLNALSVEATAAQVDALLALPFVARVDLVRAYRRRPDDESLFGRVASTAGTRATGTRDAFDYGPSAGQLDQIGVPGLHALGLHGEAVMVALFDAGFDTLSHEV